MSLILSVLTHTHTFVQVFEVARLDPENRTDPMSYVFPRMAKCTFKSFGPSGTIQVRDVMCLIATNIINEKVSLSRTHCFCVTRNTSTYKYLHDSLITF